MNHAQSSKPLGSSDNGNFINQGFILKNSDTNSVASNIAVNDGLIVNDDPTHLMLGQEMATSPMDLIRHRLGPCTISGPTERNILWFVKTGSMCPWVALVRWRLLRYAVYRQSDLSGLFSGKPDLSGRCTTKYNPANIVDASHRDSS